MRSLSAHEWEAETQNQHCHLERSETEPKDQRLLLGL
jgi:hypothetical protein